MQIKGQHLLHSLRRTGVWQSHQPACTVSLLHNICYSSVIPHKPRFSTLGNASARQLPVRCPSYVRMTHSIVRRLFKRVIPSLQGEISTLELRLLRWDTSRVKNSPSDSLSFLQRGSLQCTLSISTTSSFQCLCSQGWEFQRFDNSHSCAIIEQNFQSSSWLVE